MKIATVLIASILFTLTGCGASQQSADNATTRNKGSTTSPTFLNVKSKLCDQKEATVKNGERIYIDLDRGLIGIGFTSDQNCKVVDFKSANVSEKTGDQTKLVVVSSVGRKSSCQDEILPYAGLEFKDAILTASTLTIENIEHNANECAEIVFKF